MYCIHCGVPNPEGASFCGTCGKAVGALATPPIPGEVAQSILSSTQTSLNATGGAGPQMALPSQPSDEQYRPVVARQGKPILWILAGFAACLVIVFAMALGFHLNQDSSRSETSPVAEPAATSVPVTESSAAVEPAVDNTAAPVSAPVQVAPPSPVAAPQNPIVGRWKTTTLIGDTVLNFQADGQYTINSALVSDAGVYVFSSGDGTLRLQPNAVFSHDIIVWSCQLSGDSLSVVDPEGAGHVYTRIQQ